MRTALALLVSVLAMLSAASGQQKCPPRVTHLTCSKGDYSPQPGVTFLLQDFSAEMVARGKTPPQCFQRTTRIQKGTVFIDNHSLSGEFQTKEDQGSAKVHDINVATKDQNVALSGKIKKLILLSFTLEGPVTTDGHRLVFHPTSIKADGLPVKGLLDALGKHLDTLIQSESTGGVAVENDTLIFEPEKIAHVTGRIESVSVTKDGLLLKFAAPEQGRKTAKK